MIVNGEDVTKLSMEALRQFRVNHFGMVFQNFALFPHRTVIQNVEYGLEIRKMDPDKRKKRSMETLVQVDLEENEFQTVHSHVNARIQELEEMQIVTQMLPIRSF